jgi:hypothetical protein
MSSSGTAIKEGILIDITENKQNIPNRLDNFVQQTDLVPSSECPVDFDLTWKILHGIQVPASLESEPTVSTTAQIVAGSETLSSNTDAAHVDYSDTSNSRPNDAPQVAYGYNTNWEERTQPTETGFMRFLIFISEGCGCAYPRL